MTPPPTPFFRTAVILALITICQALCRYPLSFNRPNKVISPILPVRKMRQTWVVRSQPKGCKKRCKPGLEYRPHRRWGEKSFAWRSHGERKGKETGKWRLGPLFQDSAGRYTEWSDNLSCVTPVNPSPSENFPKSRYLVGEIGGRDDPDWLVGPRTRPTLQGLGERWAGLETESVVSLVKRKTNQALSGSVIGCCQEPSDGLRGPSYGSRRGLSPRSTSRKLTSETRRVVEKSCFRPNGDCGSKRLWWERARGRDLRHLLSIGGGGEAQLHEGDMAGDPRASLRYHPFP